jgi:hypothetical protein
MVAINKSSINHLSLGNAMDVEYKIEMFQILLGLLACSSIAERHFSSNSPHTYA